MSRSYEKDKFVGAGFLHWSGIKVVYNITKPAFSRIIDLSIRYLRTHQLYHKYTYYVLFFCNESIEEKYYDKNTMIFIGADVRPVKRLCTSRWIRTTGIE